LVEKLSVNSLTGELSNATTFNPPLFSLVNTFNLFEPLPMQLHHYLHLLTLTGTCTALTCSEITPLHATAPEIAPLLDLYMHFYLHLHLHLFCSCIPLFLIPVLVTPTLLVCRCKPFPTAPPLCPAKFASGTLCPAGFASGTLCADGAAETFWSAANWSLRFLSTCRQIARTCHAVNYEVVSTV
jgi:hypothetical protein